MRATFPDLPSVASTDPQTAQRTALSRVEADLERCTRAIAQDDALAVQIEALDQAVAKGRARIAIVEEQLGEIAGDTEALSRALVAMLPHVHGDHCPVCGRDYREVSNDPLVQRVSSQVARLTEQADRLQSLGGTRLQATNDLTKSERDRGVNNFASRFFGAVFGTLSLVLVFYLGKKLYNRYVGLFSGSSFRNIHNLLRFFKTRND